MTAFGFGAWPGSAARRSARCAILILLEAAGDMRPEPGQLAFVEAEDPRPDRFVVGGPIEPLLGLVELDQSAARSTAAPAEGEGTDDRDRPE
jgi:hypothetical protein